MSEHIEQYLRCPDCNQPKPYPWWCKYCNTNVFQQDFSKWASGNELIDKFIQNAQLNARNSQEVIEWIPYSRLRNIQYLTKGGFSTIYKAIWLDGKIDSWDSKKKQWSRMCIRLEDKDYENAKNGNIKSPLNESETDGYHVVLKSLENSSNINEEFLNEVNYYYNDMYYCN